MSQDMYAQMETLAEGESRRLGGYVTVSHVIRQLMAEALEARARTQAARPTPQEHHDG